MDAVAAGVGGRALTGVTAGAFCCAMERVAES